MRRAFPLLAFAIAGCVAGANYLDPAGPRYGMPAPEARHGGATPSPAAEETELAGRPSPVTLRIVSFNIKFAVHAQEAAELLRHNDSLRGAHIILLQEMDEAGTRAVADSLGMYWVYYPATLRSGSGRDFGNAILARWPIEDDRKILLPHAARFGGTRRIAVAGTVRPGGHAIRVYSVHLATMVGNGPTARREQLAAVLADADSFPTVIIGGDFNSETVPELAASRGYAWPTRRLPPTAKWWTLDHVLLRGFTEVPAAGVVGARGISDHKAIWLALVTPT